MTQLTVSDHLWQPIKILVLAYENKVSESEIKKHIQLNNELKSRDQPTLDAIPGPPRPCNTYIYPT
jgi:hypothetical protein